MLMLEQIGRSQDAEKAFEVWSSVPHLFDISLSSEYGSTRAPKNPKVRAYVDANIREQAEGKDMLSLVEGLVNRQAWNPMDLTALSRCTEDDWYDLFKNRLRGGRDMHFIINRVLEFDGQLSDEYKCIASKAREALLCLASESKLNKIRVARFNVMDEQASESE